MQLRGAKKVSLAVPTTNSNSLSFAVNGTSAMEKAASLLSRSKRCTVDS